MRIAIGSDHAGFHLKEKIKNFLSSEGHDVVDFGANSADRSDYPDYAKKVAQDVSVGKSQFGILVCGSGFGMCISANRFKNVRAVVLRDVSEAEITRKHNDANIACLGERTTDLESAEKIVNAFLGTTFEGGRHETRVKKIDQGVT